MVHWCWCCLFSNSNGLPDINVAVVEIITGRNNNDLVKFVSITCSVTLPVLQYSNYINVILKEKLSKKVKYHIC